MDETAREDVCEQIVQSLIELDDLADHKPGRFQSGYCGACGFRWPCPQRGARDAIAEYRRAALDG